MAQNRQQINGIPSDGHQPSGNSTPAPSANAPSYFSLSPTDSHSTTQTMPLQTPTNPQSTTWTKPLQTPLHCMQKPSYSYVNLIYMAIKSTPGEQATLKEIILYIENRLV